ncbi:MAG: MBL fold metallo-hydrolase [Candidatus Paraimprobicoccus trichonymphae]|uniref:MBL fold metallo-hydrolase n=1 Tax=Candidatus Paraimprobicoccus trichonymphae TaxID=3033793 RepID=A0AA48KY05_9FIRM|nr:MAG: MBL fold metallo-hydrolase [Candidatus Paraimprobicoccus trichonymphae]
MTRKSILKICVFLISIIILNILVNADFDGELSVDFFNVGKADCSLIKFKDKNILIDAGDIIEKGIREYNVVDYLNNKNIKKINLVIITHPHRDHIGQMRNVIENFEIESIIVSKFKEGVNYDFKIYESVLKTANSKKIDIKYVTNGDKFEFENLKINILGPCYEYNNINNASIVCTLEYGEIKFLFTGDVLKQSEKDILSKYKEDLESTVFKVPHHGSEISCFPEFLYRVNPKYSVISVGTNIRNYPSADVLKYLKNINSQVLRTDIHGTITFFTNGKDLKITTEFYPEYVGSNNDIKITAEAGIIPKTAILSAKKLASESNNGVFKIGNLDKPEEIEHIDIYDIKLLDSNNNFISNFEKDVQIWLPVRDYMNLSDLKAVFISDEEDEYFNGEIKEYEDKKYFVFNTLHLSEFGIVDTLTSQEKSNKETTNKLYLILILSIVFILGFVLFIKNKKNNPKI